MKLFSEDEQAGRRRPRHKRAGFRRIAAFVAVPLGLYVLLAVVGLLGGPGLVPWPNPGGADVNDPVAGPATTRSSTRVFPPIPADSPTPAQQTPTPTSTSTPTLRPVAQQSEPTTTGSVDCTPTPRPLIEPEDRRTTDRPSTRPADDRSNPPTPPATKSPPAPTNSPTPTLPPTPSTPSDPPGDPDQPDQPTLVDTLLDLLNRLPL